MKFSISDILKATGGKLLIENNLTGSFSISTDSRSIHHEEIFLPLTGENFDGHDYIEKALEKGARGYFIDEKHSETFKDNDDSVKFVIEVENTLEAYLRIANLARKKINPVVVAVTGSSGKTTVKEMIWNVLSTSFKTHKSLLNHNNEVGLCQTMLTMPADTEVLVAEMGMRGKGEIEILSKYAQPDIAVISNIGTAHIGRLGSIDNIAEAKCEITKYLNREGFLIAVDHDILKKHIERKNRIIYYPEHETENFKILKSNKDGSEFMYKNYLYKINAAGKHNITNALAAIETALLLGMSPLKISQGLLEFKPAEDRGGVIKLSNGAVIVNDCYNANPDSVRAAVNSFVDNYNSLNKIIILGDMAELGKFEKELNKEIGMFLKDKAFSELLIIGKSAKTIADEVKGNSIKVKTFEKTDDVCPYLQSTLQKGTAVLIKGSRCMHLESIADNLTKAGVQPC